MVAKTSPVTGNLPGAVFSGATSVLIAIDAMFVDSAHPATMFSTAASTLSSADRGEGAKTGDSKGEFMVTNNVTSSSTLLIDSGLVRTESLPHPGKYLLLSFKERLREISFEEIQSFLAELALFMFWLSLIEYVRVEKRFEMGVARRGGCIPSSNLNINFQSHILKILWALPCSVGSRLILA